MFGLSSRLNAEHRKLQDDPSLSDQGRREKAAAFAKSLVPNLVELSKPLSRARSDAAAKRAGFKLPEIDKADTVGELKRQELRNYVRNLPSSDRAAAIDTLGDDAIYAVLNAPPALSGLPPDRHEFLKTRYLERQFGKQMRDLDAIDEDTEAVQAAAQMVRRDLQIASGLNNHDFETLEKTHEN